MAVLRRLRETIRRKRSDLWANNSWIFNLDNAMSYSSLIVTEFLVKHETKVIAQPPYSPGLSPCDFFCFQNSNIRLGEHAMSRLRPQKKFAEGNKSQTGMEKSINR